MQDDPPKISVITVCYNAEKHIEGAVRSVMAQTYPHVEYLAVDGGSTDGTVAILKRYGQSIARIVSEKDRGIYDAMNKGLRLATGDLVYFLNADDRLIDDDVLGKIAGLFDQSGRPDLVIGKVCLLRPDRAAPYNPETFAGIPVNKLQLLTNGMCHQRVFARRELFADIGGFDVRYRYAADLDWILRAFNRKAKFLYSDEAVAWYDLTGFTSRWGGTIPDVVRVVFKRSTFPEFLRYFVRVGLRKIARESTAFVMRSRFRIASLCRHPGVGWIYQLGSLLARPSVVFYYLFDREGKAPFPGKALLDLTYACGLQCLMCPQSEDRKSPDSRMLRNARELTPLSREEWLRVLGDLARNGCREIFFSGGEPFLVPFLPDLIAEARRSNLSVHLISNGMHISADTADFLVKKAVASLSLSLEGSEEIDNRIKGSSEAYRGVLRALEAVDGAKKKHRSKLPRLSLAPTLSSMNAGALQFIPELASRYRAEISLSLLQFFTEGPEETGFLNDKGERRNLPENLRKFEPGALGRQWEAFQAAARKYKVPVNIQGMMNFRDILRWYVDPDFKYASRCLAPWDYLNIDPYGRMLNCMIGQSVGNVRERGLAELLNGEKYRCFRKRLRSLGIFRFCAHCCRLTNPLWGYLPGRGTGKGDPSS
jgi:glycosyltransferase involved in cell wall biosynthesis/MoaA/NifB/PqqE/SkfB family radical SAM enzyme